MFFLEIMSYLAFLKVLFQTSGMNIQNTLLDLYFIALYLFASQDFNVFLKAVFSKKKIPLQQHQNLQFYPFFSLKVLFIELADVFKILC